MNISRGFDNGPTFSRNEISIGDMFRVKRTANIESDQDRYNLKCFERLKSNDIVLVVLVPFGEIDVFIFGKDNNVTRSLYFHDLRKDLYEKI